MKRQALFRLCPHLLPLREKPDLGKSFYLLEKEGFHDLTRRRGLLEVISLFGACLKLAKGPPKTSSGPCLWSLCFLTKLLLVTAVMCSFIRKDRLGEKMSRRFTLTNAPAPSSSPSWTQRGSEEELPRQERAGEKGEGAA